MSGFRDKGFSDRLSTAENARKAMLERVRAKPGADDPAVAERRAARQAVSTAREARLAEREAAKRAQSGRATEQRLAQEANEARESGEQPSVRSLWKPSRRQPGMPAMPPERRASELIQGSAEHLKSPVTASTSHRIGHERVSGEQGGHHRTNRRLNGTSKLSGSKVACSSRPFAGPACQCS